MDSYTTLIQSFLEVQKLPYTVASHRVIPFPPPTTHFINKIESACLDLFLVCKSK